MNQKCLKETYIINKYLTLKAYSQIKSKNFKICVEVIESVSVLLMGISKAFKTIITSIL